MQSLRRALVLSLIVASIAGCFDANDAEPGGSLGGGSSGGGGGSSGSGGGSSGGADDDSGQTDVPPTSNAPPTIAGAPAALAEADLPYSFAPTASDADDDTLSFSIANQPSWATFNAATGELAGIPVDTDAGDYPDILITVSDGEDTVSLPSFAINVRESALTRVLKSGDASLVDIATVFESAIATAEAQADRCETVLSQIYPNGPVQSSWGRGVDITMSTSPQNIPLHATGTSIHSWLGERATGGGRYAVFGGFTVFTEEPVSIDLGPSTLQVLNWLTRGEPNADVRDQPLVIVMASDTDKRQFETWIASNNIVHQWTLTTDTSRIASGDFDVFFTVFGTNDLTVIDVFNDVLDQGKPVMAVPFWVSSNNAILEVFGLNWSWWRQQSPFNDFASVSELCAAGSGSTRILASIKNLQDRSLAFVYTDEACPFKVGTTTCETDLLVDANGGTLGDEFLNGATSVRNQLQALDRTGTNVFGLGNDQRLLKLMVLLGDKLRADITYPMDKETTDDTTFFSAYFADHTVHYSRPNNTFQPNPGNFSEAPETLNMEATGAATYTATPTTYSEWTSTGFYAPPGTTITVRRTDASDNDVQMRFNMLRNTVRVWNRNGYEGPKFQTSESLQLQPNTEYTLSTPYGGPIYIWSEGVAENAQAFTVEFSGILRHPFLTDFSTASIQQYLSELESGRFQWTDIKTPFVEIHSLTSRMLSAFAAHDGNVANGYTAADVQEYMSDMNTYLIVNNLSWAGFADASLTPLNANVAAFCTARNLDCTDPAIHRKPKVQHINSDNNAACGAGCSGNPFDVNWPLEALGWGESHELGHNLQRRRLKIYGGRSGEVSNNIFPIHVNTDWMRDQGLTEHPSLTRPNHDLAFAIVQDAIANSVAPSIDHPLWQGSGTYDNAFERLAFFIQLAYVHDLWDIYTLLYLMERIFTDAIKSDDKWAADKDNLGFSSYTRDEAGDGDIVNGNNFMYIATSLIDGRDFADYFEAWGIDISEKAKTQVQTNGVTGMAPTVMYYVAGNKVFNNFSNTAENVRPLDGVTAWEPAGMTAASSALTAGDAVTTGTLQRQHPAARRSDAVSVATSPPTDVSVAEAPAELTQTPGTNPETTTFGTLGAPTVTVSPLGGEYFDPVEISFVCADPDNDCQSIFYTLDGSPPTTTSLLFTAPFTLTESIRLRFIAVDAAGEVSPIVTEDYLIDPVIPYRVVAAPPGGEFDTEVEVTLICEPVDNNCNTIFYTTDGSKPTTESLVFDGPLLVEETTTLRYFGRDTDGNVTAESTSTYDIQTAPALPIASVTPPGGSFDGPVEITLNCVDPSDDCLSLFYTLDGTEPTTESILFTGPFTLQQNTILRILAIDESGNLSAPVTEVYEFPSAAPSVPTALASPVGGDFDMPVQVTLSCTDPDNDCQSIFYTLDGSEPTAESIEFTGPFVLNETTTVRFVAIDAAGNFSQLVTEVYQISAAPGVPTVSATPAGGAFDAPVQVTLSCTDPDDDCDAIFYTLDDSEPTVESIEFTGPFVLNETTTVRAIATDLQGNISPIVTQTYTIQIVIVQAPGGVSENLQLWLKANMGTDAALDGDVVASWLDQSDSAHNAVAAGTTGTQPSLELNELNFNPVIRFTDDGGRHLRSPSNPVSLDMSVIAVFRTSQTDSGVFWNAPALIGAETSGATADWALGLSSGQVHMKAQAGDDFGARSSTSSADALPHIAIGTRAAGGTTTLYIDGGNAASEVSDNVLLNAPQGVGIGNHNDPSTGGQFAGDIAEAIIYDRTLPDAERERVESYLAIKYGLTLDLATPRNYVDSTGNVIFDTSLAGTHTNDIAGIGLDNTSMLNQPRSRSGNSESLVEIGNATDQQNGEFLVWGNDGGAIDATTPVVSADRTLRRINRTWFVDKTGDLGTVDIAISSAEIPALATLAPSESYRLLIANDPEFTNPQIIDITSNVPGAITVPAVNVDDNQYFTFGIE